MTAPDFSVHPHVLECRDAVRSILPTPENHERLGEFFSRACNALLVAQQNGNPAWEALLGNVLPSLSQAERAAARAELSSDLASEAIAKLFWFDHVTDLQAASDRSISVNFLQAVDQLVSGNLEELKSLVLENPNLLSMRSPFGHQSYLLHYVSANGVENWLQQVNPETVAITQFLLESGADADCTNRAYGGGENATTLNLVVSSYHPARARIQPALVDCLVAHGANINGPLDDGTPIQTALSFGYVETARHLQANGARVDNLVVGAGLGDVDFCERWISENDEALPTHRHYSDPFGGKVTTKSGQVNYALHLAAKLGRPSIVALMIQKHAQLGFRDANHATALHWAAHHGHQQVCEILIDAGAPLDARDRQWNCTPHDWANEGGHAELAKTLEPQ